MTRRPIVAVLGGTFDRLHAGHLALLDAAFEGADEVGIGLTTPRYLAEHRKPLGGRIRSYSARRRSLLGLLRSRYRGRRFSLVALDDPFGGSLRPGVDRLVVSDETFDGARKVNARRRELRLPPVEIVLVPRVVGEDLRPIEGRRIRAGEIDPTGRRLTPVRVRVRTNDPTVSEAVRRALGAAFGRVPLAVRFEKATSNRPRGTEGPGTAVRWARPASSGTDLGIGLVRRRDGSLLVAAAIPEGPRGAFRLPARAESALDRRLERLLRAYAPQRGYRARTAHRIATR